MTPKEKAKELVDKFLCVEDGHDTDLFCDECGMSEKAAQLCALIAVDMILESCPKKWTGFEYDDDSEYYLEVKNEIEKL